MSKKVIGALLALALVLSVFSLTVFAAGTGYETDASFTQTWKLANKQGSGGTYTVDVYLTTNYKVGPIQFKLDNVDSVTAVTGGTGYYKATATPGGTSGLVILTPDSSSNLLGITLDNALVATVTYKSASNATPVIKNDVKSASNPQGTLMAARLDGDYINSGSFLVGQPATIIGLDGGTVEPPATNVTLTGVDGGFVDEARGYVYGVPVGATNVAKYFSTTGYIEMVASVAGKTNGTGATLKLYDKQGGTLKATYTLIIFGDVDGNGAVDVNDSMALDKHVAATLLIADAAFRFAADVDPNGAVDVNDSMALDKHVASTLLLKSNVRAA